MNIRGYVYSSTGIIRRTIDCPESMLSIQAQSGERVKQGECNQLTQYVVVDTDPENDVLTDKLSMPATIDKSTITADGSDKITILAPAEEITVKLSGPMFDVWTDSDGTIEWSTNVPGTYKITLSGIVRYLDKEFTVTAL